MTHQLADGRVEFRCFRPDASRVKVAGSFSEWQPLVDMMREEKDGVWTGHWVARLPLRASSTGSHAYRFEVDGRWCVDFSAPLSAGPDRSMASVVNIRNLTTSDCRKNG